MSKALCKDDWWCCSAVGYTHSLQFAIQGPYRFVRNSIDTVNVEALVEQTIEAIGTDHHRRQTFFNECWDFRLIGAKQHRKTPCLQHIADINHHIDTDKHNIVFAADCGNPKRSVKLLSNDPAAATNYANTTKGYVTSVVDRNVVCNNQWEIEGKQRKPWRKH